MAGSPKPAKGEGRPVGPRVQPAAVPAEPAVPQEQLRVSDLPLRLPDDQPGAVRLPQRRVLEQQWLHHRGPRLR